MGDFIVILIANGLERGSDGSQQGRIDRQRRFASQAGRLRKGISRSQPGTHHFTPYGKEHIDRMSVIGRKY